MRRRAKADWPDENLIAARQGLIKLLDHGHNSESRRWAAALRKVRLELRKLRDRYPEAFSSIIDHIVVCGGDYKSLLPPLTKVRISKEDLAQLLGDYRNAHHLGWGRLEYFEKVAEDGWLWGGVDVLQGNYHSGIWRTPDAVEALA